MLPPPDPLRIGVTGHRFLAEIEKLAMAIDAVLIQLAKSSPGRPFTVISALAEGADRLVVERILRYPAAKLVVVLPLHTAEYLKDFETPASRAAFEALLNQADNVYTLPEFTSREAAYEAGGRYVLEHCDVLIAVWDGQAAQGQAGTGQIVEAARQRGLPLAWVHAGNRLPGTDLPTSLGVEQGKITYERMVL